MAVSNYDLANQFAAHAPKTFRMLQDLVMAMESCVKNHGKTSFFGTDKGEKARIEFYRKLIDTFYAMLSDGIIDRSASEIDKIKAIKSQIDKFQDCFPNWQIAYAFSDIFFSIENEEAISIVRSHCKFL